MKVLVTGAGGFLGVRVVERLIAHGYDDIRCFLRDRSKTEALERLSSSFPATRLEVCYGNFRSKEDCGRALKDVQLIIHLAAGMKGSPALVHAI